MSCFSVEANNIKRDITTSKTGIYCATFDPPTQTDNILIRRALYTLGLEKLYVVIEPKSNYQNLKKRMAILKEMFDDLQQHVIVVMCMDTLKIIKSKNTFDYKKHLLTNTLLDDLIDNYQTTLSKILVPTTSLKSQQILFIYSHDIADSHNVWLELLFLWFHTYLIYGYVHMTKKFNLRTLNFYRIIIIVLSFSALWDVV